MLPSGVVTTISAGVKFHLYTQRKYIYKNYILILFFLGDTDEQSINPSAGLNRVQSSNNKIESTIEILIKILNFFEVYMQVK